MTDTLVIYYSFTGNAKKIANYVKEKKNADILELEPKTPFSSSSYDEVVDQWQNNDIKRDVEIKDVNVDLSKYKNIVLITCTWWYGISPVMKRFLKEYDLSGKNIITASTNAGWIGHSLKDYGALLKDSNIKGELNLRFSSSKGNRDEMITSIKDVDDWIKKLD